MTQKFALHKKLSFPLKISSVNVTKSAGNFAALIKFLKLKEFPSGHKLDCSLHTTIIDHLLMFKNATNYLKTPKKLMSN